MRLLLALAAGAAAFYYYSRSRRSAGSPTNASDAMDDITVAPNASTEEHLDAGVMGTFPASDPVSGKPSETAWERQQRLKKTLT